jgi:methionyl aminopeptidase
MIIRKTPREIELMRVAGEIVALTHNHLKQFVKPGISTRELDQIAEEFIRSKGATPSFKGYGGFPGSICASINEEVVHGMPTSKVLKDGDIIAIDIGANYKGYHGDSAWSYAVGAVDDEKAHLLEVTEKSLFIGLDVVKAGVRLGDVSHAIQAYAESNGLSVVRELVGHGIGSKLHEDPQIPNYGRPGTGPVLKEGMCLAIEPMLNAGARYVKTLSDDWTVVTIDEKPSAHFEHTILVTKEGYEILTKVGGE